MRTALTFILLILGACIMPGSVALGLLCWVGVFAVHSRSGVRDEQAFVAVLMCLGGLGAIVMAAVELWRRFA